MVPNAQVRFTEKELDLVVIVFFCEKEINGKTGKILFTYTYLHNTYIKS